MLILGIILLVLGIFVMSWASAAASKSFVDKPMLFHNPKAELVVHGIWILMILGSFVCFWQVSPVIVVVLVLIAGYFYYQGSVANNPKTKARKIFQIYKLAKSHKQDAPDRDVFEDVVRAYFRQLGWREDRIKSVIEVTFDNKYGPPRDKNIKDIAGTILAMEDSHINYGSSPGGIEQMMKDHARKQDGIDAAYKEVLGDTPPEPK